MRRELRRLGGRRRRAREGARRAEKHCAREAEDLGLRVAKIGDVERVGKKQYEVRLRVEERDRERWDDRWDRRDGRDRDDFRVVCRYDDRERLARID